MPDDLDFASLALRTERLYLRHWCEQDVEALTMALQDPEIQRYMPVPSPYTRADAERLVREEAPQARAAGTGLGLGVFEVASDELVGSVGLLGIHDLGAPFGGKAEIGYWSIEAVRGRGYATEAVSAVCQWAFDQLSLARIEWVAIAGNSTSWRVAEKVGFSREGALRSWLVHGGTRHDAWIGSLLEPQASPTRRVRAAAGRDPEPSAVIIDSQPVRAAATVGRETRGWDNGKKVTGRKRHIAVDTLGLLICVFVGPANVQDRDAARVLLGLLHLVRPRVKLVWADGGYAGALVKTAKRYWSLTLEIVERSDAAKGLFVVLPRRWVVERSFAHLSHARRTVRDYERLEETHEAMVRWAAIRLMTRLAAEHTT